MIPVNDILINDITTDIRKENNAWNILVTIFLEATQSEAKFPRISCHIASILHISQSELISNTREVVLGTSGKQINVNISLIVPTVNDIIFTKVYIACFIYHMFYHILYVLYIKYFLIHYLLKYLMVFFF